MTNKFGYDYYYIEKYLLEKDHKKKNKYGIPDKIEIFSVNDLW